MGHLSEKQQQLNNRDHRDLRDILDILEILDATTRTRPKKITVTVTNRSNGHAITK